MKLPISRTRAEVLLWRHGWAWPATALLLLAAACVYFALLKPARADLDASMRQVARAQAESTEGRVQPTGAARLEQVRDPLRNSPPRDELLRKLLALARAEGIVLAQSEYHQQAHAAAGVTQFQVSQPLRAGYPQLRRYIESVLRELPNASLDHISVRRDNVGQGQLEVRLRWSFWLASPAAPVAGPTMAKAGP
jgi:hypothetical protein